MDAKQVSGVPVLPGEVRVETLVSAAQLRALPELILEKPSARIEQSDEWKIFRRVLRFLTLHAAVPGDGASLMACCKITSADRLSVVRANWTPLARRFLPQRITGSRDDWAYPAMNFVNVVGGRGVLFEWRSVDEKRAPNMQPRLADLGLSSLVLPEPVTQNVVAPAPKVVGKPVGTETPRARGVSATSSLLTLADELGCGPNAAVSELAAAGLARPAIDGLIVLKHRPPGDGWREADVLVDPVWDPATIARDGPPPADLLAAMPEAFLTAIRPERFASPDRNGPKVWLREVEGGTHDDKLRLRAGGADWHARLAITKCFAEPVTLDRTYDNLVHAYRSGALDLDHDLFGVVAAAVAVITADDHLLLTLRNPKAVVDGKGFYSPSFEENWDPAFDAHPHACVRRGLREELGLTSDEVEAARESIELIAVGREWSPLYHTALIYTARIGLEAREALRRIEIADRSESSVVIGLPLRSQPVRAALGRCLAASDKLLVPEAYGDQLQRGRFFTPIKAPLHATTGAARLVAAVALVKGEA